MRHERLGSEGKHRAHPQMDERQNQTWRMLFTQVGVASRTISKVGMKESITNMFFYVCVCLIIETA